MPHYYRPHDGTGRNRLDTSSDRTAIVAVTEAVGPILQHYANEAIRRVGVAPPTSQVPFPRNQRIEGRHPVPVS